MTPTHAATVLALALTAAALHRPSVAADAPTRQEVIDTTMLPYSGPSASGVDVSTLTGKIMCGYQGWFT